MITPAFRRPRPYGHLKLAAGAGLAALAVLGASGCGSGSAAPAPAVSSAAAVKATPSPAQRILTGTKLTSLLPPVSALPAGFRLNPQYTRNSAGAVVPDSSSPLPSGQVCRRLTATAWIATAGVTGATFAENDYGNASNTEEIALEIDAFQGDDAQKVMTGLWAVFGRCQAFTYSASSMTVSTKLVRSRLAGAGDEGIKAVMTAPAFDGGMTLAAVRVGNTIVTSLYSSSHSDLGAPAVALAGTLATKLRSAG
jgi:hypothetical protein